MAGLSSESKDSPAPGPEKFRVGDGVCQLGGPSNRKGLRMEGGPGCQESL